ncbi:MAG TPA: ATP-binding protein [Candidatus Omnitrophota bacterium]|nr:MAG: Serine/threonine-protein kinase BtrW [Candidatus Omnitrophica bacterium ADurb.Bin314]HOE68717.1 ATP-binding protein [Candidatus Omnitrophota bacterium]HQB94884.1 ATP-binding protein [Candidatus Omnitrophota bacterium]
MEKVFELKAGSEVLPGLRKELRPLLAQGGWDERLSAQILLAVDEALTNVIRHAYDWNPGKIKLVFRDDSDQTEIVIEDQGVRFDPTSVPPPTLPREKPGGLGVHFIRSIMDELVYDKDFRDGNRLHMIKRKIK